MSIHDETWDRPICEHCQKEVPYGQKLFHRRKRCMNKEKTYKLNLTWEPDDCHYYNAETYCRIWGDQTLAVINNGEDYYNIEMYDREGNEMEGVAGGETIEEAQENVKIWLDEQLKRFMVEV